MWVGVYYIIFAVVWGIFLEAARRFKWKRFLARDPLFITGVIFLMIYNITRAYGR